MNKSIYKSILATTIVSFFGVAAVSNLANAQSITGAGATFPAPIYAKWAAEYNKQTGVKVNYQSVGSGAGIKQIDSKTVDFGASDMPQTDEVLKAKGQFQFPTVIGGTVPVINIKGIQPGQMKLDGQVLGDIYLGKITKWNDAAIKALNPTLALPDADIAPVRRADGSGTTFNFTNYLSRVHPEWKTKVGEGTAVNWPVGAGGKGNEGVAAFVNRLPNSIGYVEYSYVIQNKMTYTQMKNKDGVFVSPSEEAFKAAAAGADWNKSFYQLITDQPGKATWPISTATFILMHLQQDKPAQATETFKFFTWAFKSGDKLASDLDYVPLPDSVIATIEKSWGMVKDSAGKPVALK
ncbi:phosphate ABC transporter substrate-binding protein PstS [Rhodoferax sp.]|uniref:phosphate ABC transporter substrate-binding protein PstS n=1 Tax=Rhodoferax sp. TaxID=50421 RepID=UPI0025FBF94A|nr:phosphate ABC transporter substrate-binding protein PstS [Rhodoferax sp.]MCM2296346.1 phosphate ABC transporter substrate-binding protein PstS [Rhodoferax sp.]MDD3935189.1 phosphate ABC transporter substrate-binding protein PstS [Rhodoferax sp.]